MAGDSGSPKKRLRKHRWRGVVEDFVDLKLDEHSYQCIYQHTLNLMLKACRNNVDNRDLVEKGVIPALVSILAFPDRRNDAMLQRLALSILTTIVAECEDPSLCASLLNMGVIGHLHSLVKVRHNTTAEVVLAFLNAMETAGDEDVLHTAPGCVEVLIETTHCTDSAVKHRAIGLLSIMYLEDIQPTEKFQGCIRNLNHLLEDQNPKTVLFTCELYHRIIKEGSDKVSLTMMDAGILPLFAEVVKKAIKDESYTESAMRVRECLELLGGRTDEHAQRVITSEAFKCVINL